MDRRYTSRNEIGQGVLELKPQNREWAVYPRHNMSEFVVWGESIDRLAAYEDTGLTPEEITAMKIENENLHKLVDTAQTILRSDTDEEEE